MRVPIPSKASRRHPVRIDGLFCREATSHSADGGMPVTYSIQDGTKVFGQSEVLHPQAVPQTRWLPPSATE